MNETDKKVFEYLDRAKSVFRKLDQGDAFNNVDNFLIILVEIAKMIQIEERGDNSSFCFDQNGNLYVTQDK